jgi:hypothetical protein
MRDGTPLRESDVPSGPAATTRRPPPSEPAVEWFLLTSLTLRAWNQPWLHTASGWRLIGGAGVQFAWGPNGVYGLTNNPAAVYYCTGSGYGRNLDYATRAIFGSAGAALTVDVLRSGRRATSSCPHVEKGRNAQLPVTDSVPVACASELRRFSSREVSM